MEREPTEREGPVEVAGSERYRPVSRWEAVGAAVGSVVPRGRLRRWLRSAWRAGLRLVDRRVATLPGGERVRVLPDYRFLTWNPAEYHAFRAATPAGATVLDVGANVGAYALLFGRWVQPGGRVFAFEPAPQAFGGLVSHLEANGLREVVTPLPVAVVGEPGSVSFAAEGVHGTGRLGEGELTVEAVSVDSFCEREGITPTIIKVDVEGAELEVLRGARETIRRAGAGLALFMEMHPTVWRETGCCSREEMLAELARQDLRAEPLRPVPDPWALEGECLRLVRR